MKPIDLFDADTARLARDEGMARVAANDEAFTVLYAAFVARLPRGWIGTNEDIRKAWPYDQPHAPQQWGSCWGAQVRAGVLTQLPEQVRMTAVKSHARKTHLYRKVA